MTSSGALVKEALAGVRRALKERGFASKGGTFYRELEGGNTALLSTQKSAKSTEERTELTINYAVYSALLGRKLADDPAASLDVTKAHWRKRLSEGGREKWLAVTASEPVDEVVRRILDTAESVVPDLLDHATDTALRDEWLAGSSPGLGDMQRLLYAAVLVHELGPPDRLSEVLRELRASVAGSVHEGLIERQLARAGIERGS